MARIRTIKPSFWGDDAVSRMSRDARLLAIGLISMADDQGRFIGTQQAILGYVFPHDVDITPARFKKLMGEVTKAGIASTYVVDGREYGYLPKWRDHQRISHPQKSPLPDPPMEMLWD
jgi:hypothetical protein